MNICLKMNSIFKIFLYLFLNLLNENQLTSGLNQNCGHYCDCGPPARPPETTVFLTNKKLLFNKSQIYYQSESRVKYKCLDPDNLLIGSDTRTCLSGKWIGSPPKCGKQFPEFMKCKNK